MVPQIPASHEESAAQVAHVQRENAFSRMIRERGEEAVDRVNQAVLPIVVAAAPAVLDGTCAVAQGCAGLLPGVLAPAARVALQLSQERSRDALTPEAVTEASKKVADASKAAIHFVADLS